MSVAGYTFIQFALARARPRQGEANFTSISATWSLQFRHRQLRNDHCSSIRTSCKNRKAGPLRVRPGCV